MGCSAKYGSILIFVLVSLTLPLSSHVNPPCDFPHVVEIDVKDIFLFNLIKSINAHFSEDNLRTVFCHILDRHNLAFEKLNIDFSLSSVEHKLWHLRSSWCKNNGCTINKKNKREMGKDYLPTQGTSQNRDPKQAQARRGSEREQGKKKKVGK